jgi:hypothetical protein
MRWLADFLILIDDPSGFALDTVFGCRVVVVGFARFCDPEV